MINKNLLRPYLARYLPLLILLLWPLLANAQQNVDTAPLITTPTEASLLPTATPHAPASSDAVATVAEHGTYVVGEGDTLLSVAVEVGVDLQAMGCLLSPTFDMHQPLVVGTRLEVTAPDILCHTSVAGDTVQSIALAYAADPAKILADPWNGFSVNQSALTPLPAGRYVRVPITNSGCAGHGAECASQWHALPIPQPNPDKDTFLPWLLNQQINSSPLDYLGRGGPAPLRPLDAVPANWPYGSGIFRWPVSGWLTQGYRFDHRAIDIAANWGTPVAAADRGVVTRAGWNNQGYGYFVVIDHNIDYVTLYGHLSRYFVEEGDIVAKGQLIGTVGSTGNSTGPHLHFEIRDFGRLVNPLSLLNSQ